MPDDRELDVEITAGDREAELDRRFAEEERGDEDGNGADDDYRLTLV